MGTTLSYNRVMVATALHAASIHLSAAIDAKDNGNYEEVERRAGKAIASLCAAQKGAEEIRDLISFKGGKDGTPTE